MSAKPPTELLRLWKFEELPVEMSIGQILQNLVSQETSQESFQQILLKLRTDVDRLIAHASLSTDGKNRRKMSKPDKSRKSEQPN